MKPLLLAIVLVVVALQQQHVEPPDGWQCDNRAKTPTDHQCACERTCEWDPSTRTVVEKEDPKCKSWCFRKHCDCLSECDSHD